MTQYAQAIRRRDDGSIDTDVHMDEGRAARIAEAGWLWRRLRRHLVARKETGAAPLGRGARRLQPGAVETIRRG
ncbi:MAG: hypothetical protein RLO50_07705 [Azospirillaceae bacterium]